MPTYYATGVTATLATCDLNSTLSDVSSLKKPVDYRTDAARIQRAFSSGNEFLERPVGKDGSESGVIQFIGTDGDMPFYMVEAGKRAATRQNTSVNVQEEGVVKVPAVQPLGNLQLLSDDSPLTSLGATPTPTHQSFDVSPPKDPLPVQPSIEAISSLAKDNTLQHTVQAARNQRYGSDVQALILEVQTSDNSFLPSEKLGRSGKQVLNKDLKVGVFINGRLADIALIRAADERKRNALQISHNKALFSGTRINRQVEKPWVYAPEALKLECSNTDDDPERRWTLVSSFHLAEADSRGRDQFGDSPPTAEFLKALADVQFPQRVRECKGLGLIDVVITAGKGKKYGPETSYLMGPSGLDNPGYHYFQDSAKQHNQVQPTESLQKQIMAVSQDISLSPPSLRNNRDSMSPTPKKIADLTKELNLDPNIDPTKTKIGSYENSRGMIVKTAKTLSERLGDLKKMNPVNKGKELAKLKDRFGAKDPAAKKLKMEMKKPEELPHDVNPEAVLTQKRLDLALDEGAASNGALLRRIASTSPQQTPKKRTSASALAGSPTSVSVKSPLRKQPITPNRKKPGLKESANLKETMSAKSGISHSQPANETSTTPNKPKLSEPNVGESLRTFAIPMCCQDSCVRYDEDVNVVRQIGKVRGGEFKEELVLVGMRFVVV